MATCEYGHELSSRYTTTIVDWRRDANGEPQYDPRSGEKLMDRKVVPQHLAAPASTLDPTGMLALPGCPHGLPVHPITGEERKGATWVRAKYHVSDRKCVVCIGGDRPADLDVPADHRPID
jgi:hypothetical protein